MKTTLLTVLMISSLSVSAQSMDLPMCLKNLGNAQTKISDLSREKGELSREGVRLLSQNTDLREKLTSCERRPQTPSNSAELERLRTQNGELSRENLRLLSQNTDLRDRLNSCERRPQTPSAELERLTRLNNELSRENFRLSTSNTELNSQVRDLRTANASLSQRVIDLQRALDAAQNQGERSFVSVAGCTDIVGNVGNRYIAIGKGKSALEAEVNAKAENRKQYTCTYGIGILSTEEVKSFNTQAKYCVAGCLNIVGEVDGSYVSGAFGRNKTEASFNAYKALDASYSCNYGRAIYKCE